jgi:hypothetical protein
MNHIVKREINIYMIALGTVLLIALLFTIKMNYEAFTNFYFILTEEEKATYLNEPNTKSLLVGPSLCLIAIIGFIVRKKLGWILTAQLFYSFLVYVIVFGLFIEAHPLQEIVIVVGVCALMLYLLNSEKIMSYYRIEANKSLRLNMNLIVIIIGMLYTIIKGYSVIN